MHVCMSVHVHLHVRERVCVVLTCLHARMHTCMRACVHIRMFVCEYIQSPIIKHISNVKSTFSDTIHY